MESTRKSIPTPTSDIGLGSELRGLKQNGAASAAELREFLKTLKARNPQEVIGIVSSSLLIQSLGMSCVITVIFMAIFTAGPYFIYGPPKPKAATPKPAAAQNNRPSPEAGAPTENPSSTGTPSTGAPDAEKASKVMGLDEAKAADPKKNPLDKPEIDKLLDGL